MEPRPPDAEINAETDGAGISLARFECGFRLEWGKREFSERSRRTKVTAKGHRMGNRVFTGVVLLLWCSMMTWLVCAKILPTVLRGDPPPTVVQKNETVCWKVSMDGKPIGWAVSQAVAGVDSTTELHSRVLLEDIPFDRLAPRWMATLLYGFDRLRIDMRTRTVLDSLGHLSLFDATVCINELPSVVRMRGRVGEGMIHLRLQYGDVVHRVEYPWHENKSMGSELNPEARILQVYKGRKWKKEIYNPLGGPKGAIELVEAEVMEETALLVNGQRVLTKRIEYRSIGSAGISPSNRHRANLWVAEDGTLLREEIRLMDVSLRFDRTLEEDLLADAEALLELDRFATLSASDRLKAQP